MTDSSDNTDFPTISGSGGDSSNDDSCGYHLGDQIGPYKLLSILGEGGLGRVYLAQQDDPIRRQVALKIVKPGMNSKEVITRFESERQALALLDHESIARIFDAGTTATGSPYFVMEYIDGVAITEYCDRQRLSIEGRLELFIAVCEAVHHAHQKGIIHRDIKPSNVLVVVHGEKAVPKVIDFGVAKAINQPLTQRTLFTEQGKLIGTPEYMSPEQAEMANIDIDTRSDVYSLGVLLYELLTGVLPFDRKRLRKAAFLEIQRIIREEEPPKPSTRLSTLGDDAAKVALSRCTETKTLARRLQNELEWIPLKALRKERQRRYRSAAEFADDIRNYLNGAPLIAGPESAVYRATKFVHRNRPLVIGTALVLLALTAGIIVSTIFAVGQSRARTMAVKAEEQAMLEAQRARKAQDQAERLAYHGIIQTVSTKIAGKDFRQVRSMLEEADPTRRGWEWGYLMSMCHQPDWTLRAAPRSFDILADGSDGTKFLTGGAGSLTLWDLAARKAIWQKPFSGRRVTAHCVFDPRQRFVVAQKDGCLFVYDALTGDLIHQSQPREIMSLAMHPRGDKLYAGTLKGELLVFDTTTWALLKSLKLGKERLWHLALGSRGDRLAVAAGDNKQVRTILVCDSGSLEVRCSVRPSHNEGVRRLVVLDNSNILLTAEGFGTFARSLDSGQVIGWLEGHDQNVMALAASPDESTVVSASIDGKLIAYDTSQWQAGVDRYMEGPEDSRRTLKPVGSAYHDGPVLQVAALPNGKVISTSRDGILRLWSGLDAFEPSRPIAIPPCDCNGVYRLDYRDDGQKLAISGWWMCNQVILFDTTAMKIEYIDVKGFEKSQESRWVRFRPKSKELAVQTSGGLRFYDTGLTGYPQVRWLPMRRSLSDFVFDPSGSILAISDVNGVRLVDVESGARGLVALESTDIKEAKLAFSADGAALAALSQSTNGQLHLWDLTTGRLRWKTILPYKYNRNSDVAFHPQGRFIAAGLSNGEIAILDAGSGQLIRVLRGHGDGPVNSLQFSPDGQRLLSGGTDRTLRLWDWELGKSLLVIEQDWYAISVRFSPDGMSIASTDACPAGAWIRQAIPWVSPGKN